MCNALQMPVVVVFVLMNYSNDDEEEEEEEERLRFLTRSTHQDHPGALGQNTRAQPRCASESGSDLTVSEGYHIAHRWSRTTKLEVAGTRIREASGWPLPGCRCSRMTPTLGGAGEDAQWGRLRQSERWQEVVTMGGVAGLR